jgi:medium-chain acyl-[acyl-carrier-protein] hydrolase
MENNEVTDLILHSAFKVTSADTDMDARLRPGALLNFLIQSAIQSADALGFGFGGLRQEKLFWVLSRMTIHINRPLKWYDIVDVETWPKDIDGLMYLRDYILRDHSGIVVSTATSGWLAVNIETKRPGKIEGIQATILDRLKSKHAIESHPEKLPGIVPDTTCEKAITYFDIDLNKHVTSTRYVDWMMDSIPSDYLVNHYPSSISINYMKENQLGDTIHLHSVQPVPNLFCFEGTNKTKGLASFRGKFEFSSF